MRANLAAEVDAGNAWCAETICVVEAEGGSRWIPPGSRWHVAHTDDGTAYKGAAHERCNAADGARRGNVMRATGAAGNVTVVAGPPCAGKSTWIAEHRHPGDVVVDFDAIAQALGAPGRLNLATSDHAAIRLAARDARAAVIAAAKRGKYGATRTWVIQTWAGDWPDGVEVVTLDPGAEVCHARADADDRPAETHQVIDQWYAGQGSKAAPMHTHAGGAYRRAL